MIFWMIPSKQDLICPDCSLQKLLKFWCFSKSTLRETVFINPKGYAYAIKSCFSLHKKMKISSGQWAYYQHWSLPFRSKHKRKIASLISFYRFFIRFNNHCPSLPKFFFELWRNDFFAVNNVILCVICIQQYFKSLVVKFFML
jgi:hypothetical protein